MIDEALFVEYSAAIDAATRLLQEAVAQLASLLSGVEGGEKEEALTKAYSALVSRYGETAAACAVDFYRRQRAASGISDGFEPQIADGKPQIVLRQDVEQALASSGDFDGALRKLCGKSVQRAMEQADETLISNARRDPRDPRWALVPHAGACGWCIMIASNGFVYHSKAKAIATRHPSCRCRPVVDFDDDAGLSDYDPEAMREAYAQCKAAVEEDARRAWGEMSDEERASYYKKGRGRYDHYLRNRIVAEMNTRDRDWLRTGKTAAPDGAAGGPQAG